MPYVGHGLGGRVVICLIFLLRKLCSRRQRFVYLLVEQYSADLAEGVENGTSRAANIVVGIQGLQEIPSRRPQSAF